ncbi:hypothetical protein BGW80DRAFT_100367 [Lactifluus volemus]|nr:hypothetical protein BGW80DRAFT_100367 [Lactifluus volemus]
MDPQNKNTPTQSELLTRLRDEMRELDSQIMTEEASLCDLKRTATKSWMTLKFGGLQECCRKGLIIAETGKLIMTELPQLETVPGTPRPLYTGHPRTEIYVHDAMSSLGEILFDSSVPPDRVLSSQAVINQDGYRNLMVAVSTDAGSATSLAGNRDMPLRHRTQYSQDASGSSSLAERKSVDNPPAAIQADELGSWSPPSDQPRSQTFSPSQGPPPPSSNTPVRDDLLSSPLQLGSLAAPGGRFATFPVKGKRKASLVPSAGDPQGGSKSTFSEEVEQAPIKDIEPSPRYEAIEGVPPPPLAPPPGAAPPAVPQEGPYGSFDPRVYNSGPPYVPVNAGEEDEDDQLAYLEPPQSDRRVRFGSPPSRSQARYSPRIPVVARHY